VCPEVADETNPGEEASPTGRAEVGRGCAVSAGGSFLAYCSLLLGSYQGTRLRSICTELNVFLGVFPINVDDGIEKLVGHKKK